MNLTGFLNFLVALIKCAKYKIQQKQIPHDTKQCMRKITINNGWNTQIAQILHEEPDGTFIFKVILISRLPKPVAISHEFVLEIFKY